MTASPANTETLGPPKATAWARVVARLSLGAVFLISGGAKALDYQGFSRTLWIDYRFPKMAIQAAFFVPCVEIALGLALVLGWHSKTAARWVAGMLAVFSAAIVVGMFRGELDHCACFGRIADFGPIAALLRNAVLAALAIWLGWATPTAAMTRPRLKLGIVFVGTVIAAMLTGTSTHKPLRDTTSTRVGDPFPAEVLLPHGVDVRRGRWVVFGFAASCASCWDATHQIKSLAGSEHVSVVGVTASDEGEVENWQKRLEPGFDVVYLGPEVLEGMAREMPTTWLVVDGIVVDKREKGAFAAPSLFWRFEGVSAEAR